MKGHDAQLVEAARSLVTAVDGINWDAGATQASVDTILKNGKQASTDARAEALAIIAQRVRRWTPADADGTHHVAITGGSLVEYGAPAAVLADALLEKMPAVLASARRYADRCIADLPVLDEDEEDDEDEAEEEEAEAMLHVDERGISRELFRSHLEVDRPGGAALAGLEQWTLPLIASLTRDRPMLERAVADEALGKAARLMRQSDAYWLDVLLGVELRATWLVLCPLVGRGFRVIVDGAVSNFDLHTLFADVLGAQGIGKRPPASLVDYIAARSDDKGVRSADGVWNYYDWRAAEYDLSDANKVPTGAWIWNEGAPRDVPARDGTRIVLVGPPAYQRSWNVSRSFSALGATVTLDRELTADEFRATLTALKS